MTVTLEPVINFKDDPWGVPQPSMNTNCNSMSIETRLVWYALLHISEYPIFTADVYKVLEKYGETVNKSQIGHIMRKICKRGYFNRQVYKRCGSGPYYKYMPTNVFTMIQHKWRKGVA